MRLVFKNSKFAIYDDVLPPDLFETIWIHAQFETYAANLGSPNWIKVWRIGDCTPLGSTEYNWSRRPFNNYMDAIGNVFLQIAKNTADIVGDESNWSDLALRTYLYPRNTKLSWHNDSEFYSGAFTYYIHPKWGSTWGGELLVAEVPPLYEVKKKPKAGPHLDHEWEDEYILEHGVGQWIAPKPNRCVLMAGGVYHSVARVDPDAGDHARASIVGFLLKPKQAPPARVPQDEESDLEIKTLDLGGI
jgi:Rps23 Pro-64 3,4-dihydroxylase Tpa1-like proline 4-hydroxylase